MRIRPVGHKPLQVADGHRLTLDGADALAFALDLLGADAAGDGGQRIVAEEAPGGVARLALAQKLEKTRDVDVDRATLDAPRVLAHQAALGLEHGDVFRQAEVHLAEIRAPRPGLLLRHALPPDLQALLGGDAV